MAKVNKKAPPDLIFENHFSIFLIRPVTRLGENWLYSHVAESAQTWGNAVVCEPRYVADIHEGAVRDGINVRLGGLLQ